MKKELSSPLTPIDFLRASRILQVAVASVIHPAEEYSFRAHKPCEICVVRHGHCVMNIAGEDIPLKEGEFIFILPYVSHAFTTSADSPCQVFYIHFNLDFLSNPLYQLPQILKIDLRQYFMLYADRCIWGKVDFQLVLLLSRRLHNDFPIDTDYHNRFVEQALLYIQQHYQDALTVSAIAAHLGISERYLSRLFYKCTRHTVLDFINSYRINQSVLLIAEGHSLTFISESVGFSSPPHYTKVFKKYMGVTPRDYRKTLLDTIPLGSP